MAIVVENKDMLEFTLEKKLKHFSCTVETAMSKCERVELYTTIQWFKKTNLIFTTMYKMILSNRDIRVSGNFSQGNSSSARQ